MESNWLFPDLIELLDKISPFIPEGKTAIADAQKRLSRGYGEAIYQLLMTRRGKLQVDVRKLNKESSKDLFNEAIEAILKSGNLKRIYHLFLFFRKLPNPPEELIRRLLEKIIFSQDSGSKWWTYCLLRDIPEIPEDLANEGMKRNHKGFFLKKESIKIFDSFLPRWLINKDPFETSLGMKKAFFQSDSGIPIFRHSGWKLIDKDASGALLGCAPWFHGIGSKEVRVLLRPNQAVEVPAEINTISEARKSLSRKGVNNGK